MGVNPCGLKANAPWQMDVIHYHSFGKQQYLQVTAGTYSGFIMITPSISESVPKVVVHLSSCFLITSLTHSVQTDNCLTYSSKAFAAFCLSMPFIMSQASALILKARA